MALALDREAGESFGDPAPDHISVAALMREQLVRKAAVGGRPSLPTWPTVRSLTFRTQREAEEHWRAQRANPQQKMLVVVHVGDQRFQISCGSGDQSVKWLALAATQRYNLQLKRRGTLRAREVSTTSPRQCASV